jgi:DNA-binding transcriptional regulator YiaG
MLHTCVSSGMRHGANRMPQCMSMHTSKQAFYGEFMKNFSDRLRTARDRTTLTQAQLADVLKVHKFTVAKWEQGRTLPMKPTDYADIAEALNCDEAWLRDGTGEIGAYKPSLDSDRARRRYILNNLGSLPMPSKDGDSMAVDWSLIVALVRIIEAIDPNMPQDRFARALGMLYVISIKAVCVPDDSLVRSILWGIQ